MKDFEAQGAMADLLIKRAKQNGRNSLHWVRRAESFLLQGDCKQAKALLEQALVEIGCDNELLTRKSPS